MFFIIKYITTICHLYIHVSISVLLHIMIYLIKQYRKFRTDLNKLHIFASVKFISHFVPQHRVSKMYKLEILQKFTSEQPLL